jgi:hypothetical protein
VPCGMDDMMKMNDSNVRAESSIEYVMILLNDKVTQTGMEWKVVWHQVLDSLVMVYMNDGN